MNNKSIRRMQRKNFFNKAIDTSLYHRSLSSKEKEEALKNFSANMLSASNMAGGFLPDEITVTLRYAEVQEYTAATAHNQIYRGNGPYDPDYTGLGVQPLGFDELSALYVNHRVIKSDVKVTYGNLCGANAMVCVIPVLATTTFAAKEAAMCMPHSKWMTIGQVNGVSTNRLTHSMETHTILGCPRSVVQNDSDLWGDVGSVPAVQWFWYVYSGSTDSATTQVGTLSVEIQYRVTFFKRQTLQMS
jgi:hypothetical protein